MASISDLRIATPSTDKEIGPVPVSQSFLSLFMTRFRLWRSRFKRKDRQQVVGLQTVESRVSDASGAIEIELDEYLATPTALTTPSFSVRSSIRSGVVNFGDDSERVTDAHGNGLGSLTSGNTLGLEGLSRFTVVNADGVLPAARSVSDFCELHTQLETQLENSPLTNGCLTLTPSPVPLTPQDRELSLVDPFEALRAYANSDRSPLAGILESTEFNPVLDTETIKPVAHSMTAPSIDEWDVALRALATGCLASECVPKLPSSNSPSASGEIDNAANSTAPFGHGRGAGWLQFASSSVNVKIYSSNNEPPQSHAREFHIRLAATSLERARRTVRMPVNVDLGYVRFRKELKKSLTGKGDGCIWRGLETRDEPRLWVIEEVDEGDTE